jgi:hypothetical protein
LFILSGRHRARGHSQSSPPLGPPLAGRYKATSDGQKQPCSRHWTVMERLLEKSVFRQHFAQKKNIKYFTSKKKKRDFDEVHMHVRASPPSSHIAATVPCLRVDRAHGLW